MSAFEVKGWCPGALRPMESGDGLIVRVRPHCGRLSSQAALGVSHLAAAHGNGILDLTSRGNLQIRGVTPASYGSVIDGLAELGLLDPSAEAEAERNILVSPFWSDGDDVQALASALESAVVDARIGFPAKFGFAIDCAAERVLSRDAADIRIERGISGGFIVRADGSGVGVSVTRDTCVPTALALAGWFVRSGAAAAGHGRMAAHLSRGALLPRELAGDEPPTHAAAPAAPGLSQAGALVGIAFGQLEAATLGRLANVESGLRTTPWRMLLVEGSKAMPAGTDLVTEPDDPMLRVVACQGAPRCPQSRGATRTIARRLASVVPHGAVLHVSGCAKGCAHRGAASITLVATDAGYDLVRDGTAAGSATHRGLSGADLDAVVSSVMESV